MTATIIATIGYEGRAQHDVLRLLSDAGVTELVDVRIRAQSRKPGFSKSTLAAGLADAGIEYSHLRSLGTPLQIKALFKAGQVDEAREQYRDHVRSDADAQRELALLADKVHDPDARIAILCFEHDPRVCHRMVIIEELARAHAVTKVEHLGTPDVARP